MRRFWALTAGATACLLLAMALTAPTRLGFAPWHANAAFLATLALVVPAWRLLQRRRVATLAMAFAGVAATLTGFAMLYTKDFPLKEWITWWHSVTSFALLLAFLVHWLHNAPRLNEFTRRLFARDRAAGTTLAAAWLVVLTAGAWTWLTDARLAFTSGNYQLLASWAVLVGVAGTYGAWLAYRLPSLRARLASPAHRNRARALVDTSLWLSHWGALLTGFALLWFAEPLRAGPLKYVSKWWHTATSVAFLALVTLHVGFNARLLAAHARRVDDDLGAGPG